MGWKFFKPQMHTDEHRYVWGMMAGEVFYWHGCFRAEERWNGTLIDADER
jgi:hypothetical protein